RTRPFADAEMNPPHPLQRAGGERRVLRHVAAMPRAAAKAVHLLQRPLRPSEIEEIARHAAQLRVVREIDEIVDGADGVVEIGRAILDENAPARAQAKEAL